MHDNCHEAVERDEDSHPRRTSDEIASRECEYPAQWVAHVAHAEAQHERKGTREQEKYNHVDRVDDGLAHAQEAHVALCVD